MITRYGREHEDVPLEECESKDGQMVLYDDHIAAIQQLERENAGLMRKLPKLTGDVNPPFEQIGCFVMHGRSSHILCTCLTEAQATILAALLNAVYPLPPAPNQEG